MDNSEIELVGGPCGHHGPYTFYKAFKYRKNGSQRIISLCEFFFVKLWSDSDLVCIGELQLLWVDKNSEQMLASLRLYFLPENTPEGRMDHGEDEVLAISEKVVLRLEDLLTWITVDTEWTWGKSVFWEKDMDEPEPVKGDDELVNENATPLTDSALDFTDVEKERKLLDEQVTPIEKPAQSSKISLILSSPSVIVLSYPRYCRYRTLMKRLESVEARWLRHSLVVALGGFSAPGKNTRVLFCRDTFDYPDLEGHELLCNHLAPKLKGRPRGKRKKRSISPGGSESNESESSISVIPTTIKTRLTTAGGRNGLRCNSTTSPRRSTRSTENVEERDFLNKLHAFMKSHRTPIGRIPSIGCKEIDVYHLYNKVQKLGGYDSCTANRMWKIIFDEMGGHTNSTSAATIMRRHYERLLLSFERHIKGEEYKPLPVSERRRLKSKTSSFSDAESNEGDRSNSGTSTPIPTLSISSTTTPSTTPSTPNEIKEFSVPEKAIKTEGKVSSLRSVRVKPERLRDTSLKDKSLPPTSTSDKPSPVVTTTITTISNASATALTPTTAMTPTTTLTPATSGLPTTSSLPEKNSSNIPVTSAVAPVVEKSVPEKSISPFEGKENIPVMITETSMSQTRTDLNDDEPIEIPYKPPTPEIIDLDAEPEPSLTITSSSSSTIICDVKKRKLDILKEGGLEVTAITGGFSESGGNKDGRPSVIQHSVPTSPVISKTEIGNLSITMTTDSHRMPPPITSRSQSPKKSAISSLYGIRPIPIPDLSRELSRKPAMDVRIIGAKYPPVNNSPSPVNSPANSPANSPTNKPVVNGTTPPKVLQSRSIYSYSERTVYGNPKDPFMPPPHIAQAPRHLMRSSPVRPTGGEILDLTVKSPQKPIVEIVRVPNLLPKMHHVKEPMMHVKDLPKNYAKSNTAAIPGIPLIDARVGSNLEITLVPGTKNHPSTHRASSGSTNQRPTQKRNSSGQFVKNGRPPMTDYPPANLYHHALPPSQQHSTKNGAPPNLVIPSPNGRTIDPKHDHKSHHQQSQHSNAANQYLSATSPLYISQLAAAAASKNAAYLQMLDPLYYSALAQAQGLYPPPGVAPPNMFPPVPTMDQLQLYKDLVARGRFPFPLPPEATPSATLTAVGQSDPNLKK